MLQIVILMFPAFQYFVYNNSCHGHRSPLMADNLLQIAHKCTITMLRTSCYYTGKLKTLTLSVEQLLSEIYMANNNGKNYFILHLVVRLYLVWVIVFALNISVSVILSLC